MWKLSVYRQMSFFFQVQTQMFLSGRKYCDFVAWTPSSISIQRIFPDEQLWEVITTKAETFFYRCVLPELLATVYTRRPSHLSSGNIQGGQEIWCTCRQHEYGHMIQCDNNMCATGWFHISCMKLKRIPSGKWYCPNCKHN